MADPAELRAWLRLLETPGVGRDGARGLLAHFGSAEAVFDAPVAALRERVGPTVANALASEPEGLDDLVDRTLRWLDGGVTRSIVTLGDPHYPAALLQTADPPLLLYTQGRVELLNARCVAVVGSRNATPQGVENARTFARHFSGAGLTIVSGLATGIDGAAHEGGLAGPGSTIAVVGTGLDRVYPRRHHDLAHRIAENGLVIGELPLGAPPLEHHFPARNRIIAGLSLGVVVVEAAIRSGSLITARQAAEMGREVFAIPGSIHSPQSRGCHALIKQGAQLVETAQDVLDELAVAATAEPSAAPPATPHDPLLAALGHDAASLDTLVERTGFPPQRLGARLLELELAGHVVRLPGGLFQRRIAG